MVPHCGFCNVPFSTSLNGHQVSQDLRDARGSQNPKDRLPKSYPKDSPPINAIPDRLRGKQQRFSYPSDTSSRRRYPPSSLSTRKHLVPHSNQLQLHNHHLHKKRENYQVGNLLCSSCVKESLTKLQSERINTTNQLNDYKNRVNEILSKAVTPDFLSSSLDENNNDINNNNESIKALSIGLSKISHKSSKLEINEFKEKSSLIKPKINEINENIQELKKKLNEKKIFLKEMNNKINNHNIFLNNENDDINEIFKKNYENKSNINDLRAVYFQDIVSLLGIKKKNISKKKHIQISSIEEVSNNNNSNSSTAMIISFSKIPNLTRLHHIPVESLNYFMERLCHFMILISYYFNIQLPYKIILFDSTSSPSISSTKDFKISKNIKYNQNISLNFKKSIKDLTSGNVTGPYYELLKTYSIALSMLAINFKILSNNIIDNNKDLKGDSINEIVAIDEVMANLINSGTLSTIKNRNHNNNNENGNDRINTESVSKPGPVLNKEITLEDVTQTILSSMLETKDSEVISNDSSTEWNVVVLDIDGKDVPYILN